MFVDVDPEASELIVRVAEDAIPEGNVAAERRFRAAPPLTAEMTTTAAEPIRGQFVLTVTFSEAVQHLGDSATENILGYFHPGDTLIYKNVRIVSASRVSSSQWRITLRPLSDIEATAQVRLPPNQVGAEANPRQKLNLESVFEIKVDTRVTDADLASLELTATSVVGAIPLTPQFDKNRKTYSATVGAKVDSVTVSAVSRDKVGTVQIRGPGVTPSSSEREAQQEVKLAEGENVIKVVVTAEDGRTRKTYTVTVLRAFACPAPDLTGLRQIWTAKLGVGEVGTGMTYGYNPSRGSLSDANFTVSSNSYTITQLRQTTGGSLVFRLDAALSDAETADLNLHVCDEAYALSAAEIGGGGVQYDWSNTGLDWSDEDTRRLVLSAPRERDGGSVEAYHLLNRVNVGGGSLFSCTDCENIGQRGFVVRLEAHTTYVFKLRGAYDKRMWLERQEDLANIAGDEAEGTADARIEYTPHRSGDIYVFTVGAPDFDVTTLAGERFTDEGTMDEGRDCSNTIRPECGLEKGAIMRARIDSRGDRDAWSVILDPGTTYQIDVRGAGDPGGDNDGTLPDPKLKLRQLFYSDISGRFTAGNPVTNDNVSATNKNARITYTFNPSDGLQSVFNIRVSGANGTVGTYTLSVTDLTPPPQTAEPPDCAGDQTTECRSPIGRTVTGTIDPNRDMDAWRVRLEAGRTFRFDVKGAASNDGTLADPKVEALIYRAGNLLSVSTDNDGGTATNARITQLVGSSQRGDWYIRVLANDGTAGGSYTLKVAEINHRPTASDREVTVRPGRTYTFKAADFGFEDPDPFDALVSIEIVNHPTKGTLALDGKRVPPNQSVLRAQIKAGRLTFTPGSGKSGTTTRPFPSR